MKNVFKITVILLVAFMTGNALSVRVYWGPYYGHRVFIPVNYGWHYYRHSYYWYHRGGWIWVPLITLIDTLVGFRDIGDVFIN